MDHIKAGADYVVISAPPEDNVAKMVVLGVNYDKSQLDAYAPAISNASCSTNCLAVMAKVLHESFGIEHGNMITVHAVTADQSLVDSYHHTEPRKGRSAANIIPTLTGASRAVEKVLPALEGKLKSFAYRVPVQAGSLMQFNAGLTNPATPEEINEAMESASKGHLEGILEYSIEELVSGDIKGNPHSAVFDSLLTEELPGDRNVKIVGWYDNEGGYSNRLVELILNIAEHIKAKGASN